MCVRRGICHSKRHQCLRVPDPVTVPVGETSVVSVEIDATGGLEIEFAGEFFRGLATDALFR